jgi:hypothetical protein
MRRRWEFNLCMIILFFASVYFKSTVNGIKGPKWFSPSSRPVLFRCKTNPIILPFSTDGQCLHVSSFVTPKFLNPIVIVAEKLT